MIWRGKKWVSEGIFQNKGCLKYPPAHILLAGSVESSSNMKKRYGLFLSHKKGSTTFLLSLYPLVEMTKGTLECLEKAMAPHSSTLAWKIPWMEEPSRLQSRGSLRVRHDWASSLSLFTFMHWRGNGSPLQCSCLENPRDGGAWCAAVYGVAQSWTRLKWLSSTLECQCIMLRTSYTLSSCRCSFLAPRHHWLFSSGLGLMKASVHALETFYGLQRSVHLILLYWLCQSLDCVDHNKLWKILKEMGIPDHLTCLLRNLYAGQEATVRTGHEQQTGSK